ncbi:MAG: Glutamyl-tRNA(Gln) amidotransferase subunit A [Candidatus Magnetoglobus multicellularis str. Araruama]|uniref:Glutamyl-tRNA(Gln) amidotransferase subunit A n=1 Tax=Candidatus Magnetoglobus multicellularis str. Araruama TaxID=890399 RepID=A0A1V1PB54_9BACT|nr:MAG: Glutamyl-tRNA(Gln) amidotransferase subunit A [Candidatus Magnetoglobus multicellularis str. Araruama]
MTLASKTAWQLKQLLANNQTSCVEIMKSVLAEIEQKEKKVQSYLLIRDTNALIAEAQSMDNKRASGDAIGPLAGLPIAIKDNICTKNIPTTCGSKILENFCPIYDATIIEKIRQADGIIIGKTNMDEFAMGSSTENSAFHPTHNPKKLNLVPGGSSGGSAAAVAANECIMAIGSDTGGSIRQPSAFCGVVGIKPTYGRVSRYGLIAFASSLDQIGAIAKDVRDTALMSQVISGYDAKDSTSVNTDLPDYMACLESPKQLTIGVPEEYFGDGLDNSVREQIQSAIALMKDNGHKIISVNFPYTEYAIPTYYIIACAEASSNLARYDGCRYGFRAPDVKDIQSLFTETRHQGFGPEVKRRIMLGTYVLSAGYYDAYYNKAAKVRNLIAQNLSEIFTQCDVIMHPSTPTPAFKLEENTDDPLAMYMQDIFTVNANLAGVPAMNIPCGLIDELPVGIHLIADKLQETTLFQAAIQLENILHISKGWVQDFL